MSFRISAAFAPLTVLAVFMPFAHADNGKNWEGEAELGLLISSGNSDETNINSRIGLEHEIAHWRNKGELSTAYSEAEEKTTAEEYEASLETNYKFDEKQYWFLRGSFDKDRFSGYDFESTTTTGYGNRVWSSGKRSFLDLAAGVGYRYNKLDEPDSDGNDVEKETIGRFAGQFDYELSDNARFRQKLSTEIGFNENNIISQSETAIQANIVGNLSMKAAYRVKHISDAPVDSAKTDTETSISLLYGF